MSRSARVHAISQILRLSPGLRRVAAGYAAKLACSAHFGAGRELDSILAEDLEGVPDPQISFDEARREVRVQVRGCERRAVYRDDLGGVLLHDQEDLGIAALPERPPRRTPELPWPAGEAAPAEWPLPRSARAALGEVLDEAFSEPHPQPRRTRAVVIVQHGRLVAERYAPGFSHDRRLLGWSMTKSVVNALCGRLVELGQLDLREPLTALEWGRDDPRGRISFDSFLRMESGLRFWEQYWNPLSHVVGMLFNRPSAAAYAASFKAVARPDTHWSYASGTSNVVARAAMARMGNQREALSFPARELFDKIGMTSAQLEIDASGHFVGSSFCWATARDWARFGQLYLQRGEWEGERLLPAGWWEYTSRPTPNAPEGEYGAHFWLNAGKGRRRMHPTLPDELVMARGFEEQSITIVPSRQLVIVRLGQTAHRPAWDFDGFIRGVLRALPT